MSGLTSDYGTIQYGTSANQPRPELVYIVTDDNYVQTEVSGATFESLDGELIVYRGDTTRRAIWARHRWTSIVEKVKDE